ncbi:MAG: hypothetical protein HFG20_01630 [Anaerotruncus sp.]|jgi:hypothetical protein|nr:hypothetical protein [Anaerotruncus sp.]
MDATQVLAQFARLSGLSLEQAQEWSVLCDAAAARLEGMLREDADTADARLALAAAGMAYYQYRLLRQDGSASSVKIGEVSVSNSSESGRLEDVRTLQEELLAAAAPLLDGCCAGLRQVDSWIR